MISFIHTADTHLGVENYGKLDSKTGLHTRLLDFQKSFEQVIDFSIKKNVDFFLFCGDAYKTAYPTPTQQKLFLQPLMKLYNAKIPVVIVVGNHDHPLSFGKANSLDVFNSLPLDGFYVLSKPELLELKTKNGIVQIVGIPWPTRNNLITSTEHHLKDSKEITNHLSNAIGKIIQNFASKLDPKNPAILAGHLTVTNGIFSGSEKRAIFGNDPTFLPSQLAVKPFNYVALGHLHRYQNLNSKGDIPIVYSGSTEKIDFGERKEEKGFCFGKIDPSTNKCSYEFIKLKTRPMIQLEIELKSNKDQTKQILEKLANIDINEAILKIIYHIPEDKTDNVDLQEIQRACSKAMQLVSVIPIRKISTREKRICLKVDMNLETMLQKYLETKDDLKLDKEKIIKKAMELYNNLTTDENL